MASHSVHKRTRHQSDHNWAIAFEEQEKICQLKNKVEALAKENTELLILLQNERRRSETLQQELRIAGRNENSLTMNTKEDTSEKVLNDIVLVLKEKLEMKENEYDDLEHKFSMMKNELCVQVQEMACINLQHDQQMKYLHQLLVEEREHNHVLSEESDQTVRELQMKLEQKNERNEEMKMIQEKTCERLKAMEAQLHSYEERFGETEELLRSKTRERKWSDSRERLDVSCQVCQDDIDDVTKHDRELHNNWLLCKAFLQFWQGHDFEMIKLSKSQRYQMNIFNIIRNGFQKI